MTTQPTEDEARTLLAKAAATIDVDESAPMTLTGLPEPRPRRWPVLAAAAAVVLAIAGGSLVAQQLGDDPQPAPAPANTDREPVEQEHVYADDEMPSLLGYTEEEATELLSRRGFAVEVRVEHSCDQPRGYVLGADPGPGTPMEAGDSVQVRVTGGPPPAGSCVKPALQRQPVWQQVFDLARFARGLGPAPDFPGEVSITAGEGRQLTAAEAADPENWVLCDEGECHSALAALEQILTSPVEMDAFFAHTYLVVTDDLPVVDFVREGPTCLTLDPYETGLPYHAPTYVYVDYPKDGVLPLCPPPPVVKINWSEDRRIAGVRLLLAVDAETSDIEELEPTAERKEAAEAFVAWARGEGRPPTFAPSVRLMLYGSEMTEIDNPERRPAWRKRCPRFMSMACPKGAVEAFRDTLGDVAMSTTRARGCGARPGLSPDDLVAAAETDLIRVHDPEADGCEEQWSVELWIDETGVIYAVNATVPRL